MFYFVAVVVVQMNGCKFVIECLTLYLINGINVTTLAMFFWEKYSLLLKHEILKKLVTKILHWDVSFRAVHPQDLDIQNACQQPGKVVGPCHAQKPRYYFDGVSRTCRIFFYGGCAGNDNNFASVADCIEMCPVNKAAQQNRLKICELPKQVIGM